MNCNHQVSQVVVWFFSIFLAGCSSQRITNEERERSILKYEAVEVRGNSLRNFVIGRSAMLVNASQLSVSNSGEGRAIDLDSVSVAIPIDSRGYFLTAAHCVKTKAQRIVFPNESGRIESHLAEVVWRGQDSTTGLDLALMKINSSVDGSFSWSTDVVIPSDAVSSGVNYTEEDSENEVVMDLTGGEIVRSTEKSYEGIKYQVIQHTTPIRKGDSGGPLLNLRGELVGVNFAADAVESGLRTPIPRRSYAIRPDLKWLRMLIENDSA